jgi:excisionase family DNA binding protein
MNTNFTFTTLSEQTIKEIIETSVKAALLENCKLKDEKIELFITRKETAKLLGISLPTLRSWTISNKLPSYRISSRIRYKQSEVIAYLESGLVKVQR